MYVLPSLFLHMPQIACFFKDQLAVRFFIGFAILLL